MVEGGYITQAEADYIYSVELAGGVLSSGGSGGSGGRKSSSSSGTKASNATSVDDSALKTDKIKYSDYMQIVNAVAKSEGANAANQVGSELRKNYQITNVPGKYENFDKGLPSTKKKNFKPAIKK